MNDCEICQCVNEGRFVVKEGVIFDNEGEIAPIKVECATEDGSESQYIDPMGLTHFLNNIFIPKESVDCSKPLKEMIMDIEVENEKLFYGNGLISRLAEKIPQYRGGYMYLFFDMGSVKLDIDDPINWVKFHEDFIEIFNNENGETTLLKSSELKGFVFENKPVELEDLKEDLSNDDE